jgi:hypothetical protein
VQSIRHSYEDEHPAELPVARGWRPRRRQLRGRMAAHRRDTIAVGTRIFRVFVFLERRCPMARQVAASER